MDNKHKVRPVPKETRADDIHRTARALVSAVPVVGGPASELFDRLLAPPIRRRRDAWLSELAEQVASLQQAGHVSMADLQRDEEFISTVMQASMVAIRNHRQEKLDALRNAVLNTAMGRAPDDTKREMFLALVDRFTTWHMGILRALHDVDDDPTEPQRIKTSVTSITDKVVRLMPALQEQRDVAEVAIEDLCQRGLLFWNRAGGAMYIRRSDKQVSALGCEFLRFIAEPSGQTGAEQNVG